MRKHPLYAQKIGRVKRVAKIEVNELRALSTKDWPDYISLCEIDEGKIGFKEMSFPHMQFYGHQSFDSWVSSRYGYRKHSDCLRDVAHYLFHRLKPLNTDIDYLIFRKYID